MSYRLPLVSSLPVLVLKTKGGKICEPQRMRFRNKFIRFTGKSFRKKEIRALI